MNRTWLAAGGLGLLTVVLRLPRAFGDAFWQDEVASARIIREPTFGGMLHHVVRTESTPPLWYALGWVTHRAGLSVHDVRLLSVAAGAVLVTLVVRIFADVVQLELAATSGFLLAVASQFSAHGRELRAYELFALLTVVFAIALHRAARHASSGRLVALGASTAAGEMTHYFFAFTLAAGLIWLWLEPLGRSSRRQVTIAIAAGLVVCSVWLPMFVSQYRHDAYSWIGPFNGWATLETPLRIFSPRIATAITGTAFLAWLSLGAWFAVRRGPVERLIAALALVPLAIGGLVWLAGINVFATRNMIGIGPFVACLVVLPLGAVRAHRLLPVAASIAIAVTATSLFVIGQQPAAPFGRIAAALVHEGWRPPDSVLVPADFSAYRSPLEWYLPDLPELIPEHSSRYPRHTTFAVLLGHSLPHQAATQTIRIGAFLVARMRPSSVRRWAQRRVILTVAPPPPRAWWQAPRLTRS